MKKIIRILSLLLAIIFVLPVFTACDITEKVGGFLGNFIVIEEEGAGESTGGGNLITIEWVQGQKVLRTETVERGSILTPWTPESEGMEFQGWYERPYIKKFDFSKPVTKSTRIFASFKSTGDVEIGPGDEMPDWYLIGSGKGELLKKCNWSHEVAAANLGLYAGEDGIYKITLSLYAGDQFKMTKDLGWDNEKAIDKMAGFADGVVKDSNGTVIFTAGENNNFVVADGQDGKYEISYNAEEDKMYFKFIEKLESIPDDIRLIGTNNGWSTSYGEDDYKFTTTDYENWTYTWEVAPGNTFPVTFKVYNVINGNYYPGGVGNDLHIDVEGTYTIYFNSKTREIVVKDANGNPVDVGFTAGGNEGGEGGGTTVTPNANPTDKVYVVLDSAWSNDSMMGAWVWPGDQWADFVPTETPNVYEVSIPVGANMIIFVDFNGSEKNWDDKRVQTSDLAVPDKSDDKIYYHVSNGTWSNNPESSGSGSGNTPGQLPEGDGILVFFQNNWKWTEVSAYFWGSQTGTNPGWPGNAMTLVGEVDGNEVYAIRVPADITGLIFNGVKDDGSGNRDQTPDIKDGIVDGKGWKMDWINNANAAVEFVYNPNGCSHSSEGEGTVVVEATCTAGGQTSYVCSKCAETYTLNTPALGHSFGADGNCSRCDASAVYSVVGTIPGLSWEPSDTAGDMTFDSATGVYTKVFENVAAGTYEYKVVLNHKWGEGQYPTDVSNASVQVVSDGSTITVTWNPATQTLDAKAS